MIAPPSFPTDSTPLRQSAALESRGHHHRPLPQHPSGISPISKESGSFGVVEYYGYRYYHTNLGRWLSRDPIAEKGGLNIYRFLNNRVSRSLDVLGLTGWQISGPQDWWINNTCPDDGAPFAPTDSLPPGFLGMGLEGEVNQNRYFETNNSEEISGIEDMLRWKLKVLLEDELCCSEPSTADPGPENDQFPSSRNIVMFYISMNLEVGRATARMVNVKINWSHGSYPMKNYTWTADMIISDTLGYTNRADELPFQKVMYYLLGSGGCGLLPQRDIVRARWKLEGYGRCCCKS